ncbi:hypothetical protein U1Q18_012587 [Sarracenia purpurea var. burkii]
MNHKCWVCYLEEDGTGEGKIRVCRRRGTRRLGFAVSNEMALEKGSLPIEKGEEIRVAVSRGMAPEKGRLGLAVGEGLGD